MGTNYYITHKDETLHKVFGNVHLGKNSYGWYFSLHVYPERDIMSWKDWSRVFENNQDLVIVDEYGKQCSLVEFKQLLMKDRSLDNTVDMNQLEHCADEESRHCNVKLDREHRLLYQDRSMPINCIGIDPNVRATLLVGDFS